MRIAFVFQYYPYQYDQFKEVINYFDSDSYYRIHTEDRYKKPISKIYKVGTNEEVTEDNFKKDYYDCLIYTGTWCKSLLKFSNKCRYKNIICISHSLIGSLYDISIVTPTDSRSIGIVPESWKNFDSFNKRINTAGSPCYYIFSKSHPMISSVICDKPKVSIEKDTLGVIFGEKSPFDHFCRIVDELVDKFNFKKVKIKFHPLNYGRDDLIRLFDNRGYEIEILPIDYNKYDWTDSCEYIIGGCSSLLIESIIRSKYFDLNQKFKQFPFPRRGISLSIENYESQNWSTDAPEFTEWLNVDSLEDFHNTLKSICSIN